MGWVERLYAEKNEEGYLRIEIRPEGYIDRLYSDITLNRRDMRSKFGYTMLYAIVSKRLKMKFDIIDVKHMDALRMIRKKNGEYASEV